MARPARADVELELPVGRRGENAASANVERKRAHLRARLDQRGAGYFSGVEDGVHDAVVAEVRPGVVHVEDGDVETVAIRRRRGVTDSDELEKIVMVVDVAFFHRRGQDASGMPCSVSEMM